MVGPATYRDPAAAPTKPSETVHAAATAALAHRVIHFADGGIREMVCNRQRLTASEIDW